MVFNQNDHAWNPDDDIQQRLMMLGELYPWRIALGLDDEGRDYLTQQVLPSCEGRILLTDNGGGELTEKHWRAVCDHIGWAAVIVWTTCPDDITRVRAGCLPEPD